MKILFCISTIFFAPLIFCNAQIPTKSNSSSSKFHNKIDDIKTVYDIDRLLDSINKKQFEVFIVKETLAIKDKECREFAEKVEAKSWTKADFDNNGYTDILITGDNFGITSIVVMDKGKNNFVVKNLSGILSFCSFPLVDDTKPQPFINYYEFSRNQPTEKTLIYKYGISLK